MIVAARRPPCWALASSTAAMIFLIGGWTVAGAVAPAAYNPVHDTISALAAHGVAHRWIMTLGLAGLGVAHLVTAAGLHAVRPGSRAVLALGGAATLAVAVFAQPRRGSSPTHITLATVAFVALALWPATTSTRDRGAAAPLRAVVAVAATTVSSALLIWVGVTLGGGPLGVSERLLTFEQALWPFVVVVALRHHAGRMAS